MPAEISAAVTALIIVLIGLLILGKEETMAAVPAAVRVKRREK